VALSDRLAVGIVLALAYLGLVLLLPHDIPLSQGVESDFFVTYAAQAQQVGDYVAKRNPDPHYNYFDHSSWRYHGLPYPIIIWTVSQLFKADEPVKGWQYFRAGKVISAVAGASLLGLAVLAFGGAGVLVALVLGCLPMFLNYSFYVGSDMIACALSLWAIFFFVKVGWRWPLLAGVLFSLSVGVRHEYLALLPVGIIYALRDLGWKPLLPFLAPVLLLLVVSSGGWSGHCTMPDKYLGTLHFDEFPPQAFAQSDMDTVENFYSWRERALKASYPGLLSIWREAGLWMPLIFFRDLGRTVYLVISCVLFPLVFFVLGFRKWFWYVVGLMAAHVLLTNFAGVWTDRYFLFELILIVGLGIWALSQLPSRWVKYGLLLVCLIAFLPACWQQVAQNKRLLQHEFVMFRREPTWFVQQQRGADHRPKLLSTRGQAAFIAGWDWQCLPKNVHNLHEYCLRFGIDYVLWTGFEQRLRPEWAGKMNDPNTARPEFQLVSYGNYGYLYAPVRDADSTDTPRQ